VLQTNSHKNVALLTVVDAVAAAAVAAAAISFGYQLVSADWVHDAARRQRRRAYWRVRRLSAEIYKVIPPSATSIGEFMTRRVGNANSRAGDRHLRVGEVGAFSHSSLQRADQEATSFAGFTRNIT
jgi:hypothetical protein